VKLTEAEWFGAIEFLTATGQQCDDARQEFILLSDTLGVSMVVDLINHRKPEGATESTVFGPFHRDGAPEMAAGATSRRTTGRGTPMLIGGGTRSCAVIRSPAHNSTSGRRIRAAGTIRSTTTATNCTCAESFAPAATDATWCGQCGRALRDSQRRPGRTDAPCDESASLAARPRALRRLGWRIRAGDDASVRRTTIRTSSPIPCSR